MKATHLSLIVFITLLCTYPTLNVLAENELDEQHALDILIAQIKQDKLYDSWTTISCLFFLTEEKTRDYFDIAIREKHEDGCPGDRATAPIVDRFRVDRLSKKIKWYQPAEDEFLPYEAVFKVRLKSQ